MSSFLTCAVEETDRYFGLVNLKTMYKYDGMTFGSEDIGAGRFFIWTVEIFISTIIFSIRAFC